MIDLVLVDGSIICYAPFGEVGVGDTVKIKPHSSALEGTVTEQISTYDGNEVFKFFKKNTKISPVLAVVKKIHYEGEENDLSD